MNTLRTKVSAVVIFLILVWAAAALADPCLVVYPTGPTVYHFDPAGYYTVGPGNPLYDPTYDRGGQVLLTIGSNAIDQSIYQAEDLVGFTADANDQGFYFEGGEFDLVIDGFARTPTTFVNVLTIVDRFVPPDCTPEFTIDGVPLQGLIYRAGSLTVSTPTEDGNNYSDVQVHHVTWTGCYGVHVWAFSDQDNDGNRDGGECFTAYSHDMTVPVQNQTWGGLKSFYR